VTYRSFCQENLQVWIVDEAGQRDNPHSVSSGRDIVRKKLRSSLDNCIYMRSSSARAEQLFLPSFFFLVGLRCSNNTNPASRFKKTTTFWRTRINFSYCIFTSHESEDAKVTLLRIFYYRHNVLRRTYLCWLFRWLLIAARTSNLTFPSIFLWIISTWKGFKLRILIEKIKETFISVSPSQLVARNVGHLWLRWCLS
jgi:hypothetical protein